MRQIIAKQGGIRLILGLFTLSLLSCSQKSTEKETAVSSQHQVAVSSTAVEEQPTTAEQEDFKLIGTSPTLYASSEETLLNMLNEADQLRLQKAIQILSNQVAETIDLYTEDDDIDFDKWHAAYCKKVHGLTFNTMVQAAEQTLKDIKNKNITHLQEEIMDLKNNPAENQEESMLFLQEELEKAKQLPATIDAYIYSEACFF